MINILLADGEYIENEAMKFIILNKAKGISVVGMGCNGQEVLNLNNEHHPDIIFLDVVLPGLCGLDVAKKIREENKNVKIIMMSETKEFELVQKALRAKVDDYLLKPIKQDTILNILNNYYDFNYEKNFEDCKIQMFQAIKGSNWKISREKLSLIYRLGINCSVAQYKELAKSLMNEFFDTLNEIREDNCFFEKKSFDLCKSIDEVRNLAFEEMDKVLYLIEEEDKKENTSLKSAVKFIEINFRNNIMLQDVADELNFSPTYLSKRFKKDLGTNFNKYLTQRRLKEAKKLLTSTNESINDIAFDIGYNEPNYFCKVFKKSEGITPSEFRENGKKVYM